MAAHRSNSVIASFAGAGILAAAALAVATPVTPPPGAIVTTAHPDFTWTLSANEQSYGIFIASKPDVTPEGKFYDENIVDFDLLSADVRELSPSSPLYAGHYWWNIWSVDRDTFASFYSAPSAFTIPVSLRLRGVKTKRHLFSHSLDVDVRWTANVQWTLIRVRLLRGRKVMMKASDTAYNSIGAPGSRSFSWYRPGRIKQGTRLKLLASISSGGVTRTRALVVRAP